MDNINQIIKEETDNFILSEVETELQDLLSEEIMTTTALLPSFGSRQNSISEETYKVYHGTNQEFDRFSTKLATQGIIWFTDSVDSIKRGEHGGMGSKIIMTRYITMNNPAGWDEYDKYGLQQIEDMGFDGIILPHGTEYNDYIMFSNKNIRKTN